MAHEKLLCPIERKADIEIANQAQVAEFLAEFVQHNRTRITLADILQIHALTIEGIYPCAGNFRDALSLVEITDTDHKPAHPAHVRLDVVDMLEWLYSPDGRPKSALEGASFVLWKLNASACSGTSMSRSRRRGPSSRAWRGSLWKWPEA
jgi:fido (protein-threonine AMPylation protein)